MLSNTVMMAITPGTSLRLSLGTELVGSLLTVWHSRQPFGMKVQSCPVLR